MTNLAGLRTHLVELARARQGLPPGSRPSINKLFDEVVAASDGSTKVSRSSFYSWFSEVGEPSPGILELIPGFSSALGEPESSLWISAGMLSLPRPQLEAARLTDALGDLTRSRLTSGLARAESVVVDLLVNFDSGLTVTVVPVVRGRGGNEIHLHSLVGFAYAGTADAGVGASPRRVDRQRTMRLRERLRSHVIPDDVWTGLGLSHRDAMPSEWGGAPGGTQFIEVPVFERCRHEPTSTDLGRLGRLLVIGQPWAHAELLSALVADLFGLCSYDFRYLGFRGSYDEVRAQKMAFARTFLTEHRDGASLAVAEKHDLMAELAPCSRELRSNDCVVTVSYGRELSGVAAQILRTSATDIERSSATLQRWRNGVPPGVAVISLNISDSDVLAEVNDTGRDQPLLRDNMVEVIHALSNRVGEMIVERFGSALLDAGTAIGGTVGDHRMMTLRSSAAWRSPDRRSGG